MPDPMMSRVGVKHADMSRIFVTGNGAYKDAVSEGERGGEGVLYQSQSEYPFAYLLSARSPENLTDHIRRVKRRAGFEHEDGDLLLVVCHGEVKRDLTHLHVNTMCIVIHFFWHLFSAIMFAKD